VFEEGDTSDVQTQVARDTAKIETKNSNYLDHPMESYSNRKTLILNKDLNHNQYEDMAVVHPSSSRPLFGGNQAMKIQDWEDRLLEQQQRTI